MNARKIYLTVTAEFAKEGGIKPLSFVWEDGRIFDIERVEKIERAPARTDALLPIRYTCLIAGKRRFLFFIPQKLIWFVEIENWRSTMSDIVLKY